MNIWLGVIDDEMELLVINLSPEGLRTQSK